MSILRSAEDLGLIKVSAPAEDRRRRRRYVAAGLTAAAAGAAGIALLRRRGSAAAARHTRPPGPSPAATPPARAPVDPNSMARMRATPAAPPGPAPPAAGPTPYERLMRTPPPGGWNDEAIQDLDITKYWEPSDGFSAIPKKSPRERWTPDGVDEWGSRLRKEFSELKAAGVKGEPFDPSVMRVTGGSPVGDATVTGVNRTGLHVQGKSPLFMADVTAAEI